MSKEHYVFSTLSTDTAYTDYADGGGDMPVVKSTITIKGGANVADKNLVTPMGVMTKVSEEELAALKNNKVFQLHEKNGYIKVMEKPYGIEEVVVGEGMKEKDASAPLTPSDYEDSNGPQPVVAKGKKGKKA